MAQEQAKQLLQKGIAAAQGGRPDIARDLLRQAIQYDPQNEIAWLWLSSVAQDKKERVFCLRQLLKINPNNETALKGLRALGVSEQEASTLEAAASSASSVPMVIEDKYARIQQSVDDFLRRYNPQPADALSIEWTHKTKRRYGEQGAQRLRRMTYAAAALGIIVVAGIVLVVLSSLGVFSGGNSDEGEAGFVRRSSSTPTQTMTPTPGGATPTPLPAAVALVLTATPEGLPSGVKQGSVYEYSPTEVYPRIDTNVAGPIRGAIDFYSIGKYSEAIGTLTVEHEQSGSHCYSAVIYFEAMSYADRDASRSDLETAAQLLMDALNYTPENTRYKSCQNDPLLYAGLGHVYYLQGNLNQAMAWTTNALEADSNLVQANVTKAQVELALDQIPAAWTTINTALRQHPGDVNLLLMAGQIELAGNQAASGLEYARQALYVDPSSQAALQLQVQSMLMLADQIPDNDVESKVEYYSLAVVGAQTLLLYYPGDPLGYLYLAKARVGEGNYTLAETALTRVISAESTLPESAFQLVTDAYQLRGDLYYRQGRLAEAKTDFEQVIASGLVDDSGDVASRLVDIAFKLGDYLDGMDELERLLYVDQTNKTYQLLRAKALVELCTFYPRQFPQCEYSDMLDLLSDDFIMGLDFEYQRADAYSYRGQARYHKTEAESRSLSDGERELAFQLALNDLNDALTTRQSPVDHYYRGLLLEQLGQPAEALREYQWVVYWNTLYPYPFTDDEFDQHVADLTAQVELMAGPTQEPAGGDNTAATPERTPTAVPTEARTPEPPPTVVETTPPSAPQLP